MKWERFGNWETLFNDVDRLARLYHEDYYPRWTARLVDNSDNGKDTRITRITLDPSLTWEEAKLVVQTLVGAQLS